MHKALTVLIAGGTGLIGSALRKELERRGHKVAVLSRHPTPDAGGADAKRGSPAPAQSAPPQSAPAQSAPAQSAPAQSAPARSFQWEPGSGTLDLLQLSEVMGSRIDAVVNLAGSSISRMPWTSSRRADILTSRLAATHELVAAIAHLPANSRPSTLLNASAVGFYGSRGDEKLTELSAAGGGFLAEVTQAWEAEAATGLPPQTRLVLARTGLVLAQSGALAPLRLLTKMFAAGPLAGGKTWWPWISLRDEINALCFLLETPSISGPVNLVGPTAATSSDVMRTVASLLHRPFWLPAPRFAISLALGQAGRELLLSSQRVVPEVLTKYGYTFADKTVESAVSAILPER